MALTIPNLESSPTFDAQAIPDETDWLTLQAAPTNEAGVLAGCTVTAQSSPNMTVQVAAGRVINDQLGVVVAAVPSLTIAAASATDRKDIVVVNSSGVVSVVQGTACGTAGWSRSTVTPFVNPPPIKPAIPADSVLLAEVYVASSTTSIASGNIIDKTTPAPGTGTVNDYGADPTGAADSTAAFNAAVAALPTVTTVQAGTTRTIAIGTVKFGAGRYKMNSAGTMATVTGPWTTVTAPALGSTTLYDYNSSTVSISCTTTSGSTTLPTSGNYLTAGVVAGMTVTGVDIPTNTLVKDVTASSLTLSQAATGVGSNTNTLKFTLPGFGASNPYAYPGTAPPPAVSLPISGGSGLLFNGGGWNNIIFDGMNATPGLNCFEIYGGGECWQFDCAVQNYPGSNIGVVLMDYAYDPVSDAFASCWCEGWQIRLRWSINVQQAFQFRGAAGAHTSNSQGSLRIDKLIGNPGQTGVAVANGSWVYHSSIYAAGVLREGTLGNAGFTTVASGSNGVNVNTLTGTQTLSVVTPGNLLSTGTNVVQVPTSDNTYAFLSYTGVSGSTLTGVTLLGGTGTLSTGAFVISPAATAGKVLLVTGTNSSINNSRIELGVECDQFVNDPGTTLPQTLNVDDSNSATIKNCWGFMDFTGGQTMTPAVATSGTWGANALQFSGPVNGDTHLAYHTPVGGPNNLSLDH